MNSSILLTILGAALATYFTRFPLLMLSGKKPLPVWLTQMMSFIAPAVLTALIIPVILVRKGHPALSLSNEYIPATIVAVVVAYFSKNMLVTVIAGVGTVALLVYF